MGKKKESKYLLITLIIVGFIIFGFSSGFFSIIPPDDGSVEMAKGDTYNIGSNIISIDDFVKERVCIWTNAPNEPKQKSTSAMGVYTKYSVNGVTKIQSPLVVWADKLNPHECGFFTGFDVVGYAPDPYIPKVPANGGIVIKNKYWFYGEVPSQVWNHVYGSQTSVPTINKLDWKFEIIGTPDLTMIYQGKNKVLTSETYYPTFKVTNNWDSGLYSVVVRYKVPTFFGSEEAEVRQYDIMLNMGENTVVLPEPVPITYSVLLNVEVELYQKFEFADKDHLHKVGNMLIFDILISEKPIYIDLPDTGCPVGYEISLDGLYCVRSDIKDLPCMLMGCPSVPGHDYECTSAGICAETIYVYKDCTTEGCIEGDTCLSNGVCRHIETYTEYLTCATEGCPEGYTCESDGTCIKETLIPGDCSIFGCDDGSCQPDGSCLLIETYTEYLTCETEGCPEGYTCESDGTCIQTIEKRLTCVDEPSWCGEGFTCDPQTQVCMENHVYQEIGDCITSSDCYMPCDGIAVSCIIPEDSSSGYCKYDGECSVQTLDCKDLGCSQGYECTQSGTCEKTELILQTCSEVGCQSGYVCNTQSGSCEITIYQNANCITEGCDFGYECNQVRGVCERTVVDTQTITIMGDKSLMLPIIVGVIMFGLLLFVIFTKKK